ncbi:MAG: hypothetical protein II969_05005 [Anaerolineaceae bacterium]|nr:hypothetical protein [Anaerolineaceae bacterium]
MKLKYISIILFLLAALGLFFTTVFAEVNPETLLRTADSEIFIRAGFTQDYSKDQDYINEFIDENIIHQYFTAHGRTSEVLTSLRPSPVNISINNPNLRFENQRVRGFHASFKMKRSESVPENAGYCWLSYSNRFQTGAGKESGVILYPGYKAFYFAPENDKLVYTEIADLSEFNRNRDVRIDIIRLDGISYFYFDKYFVFQYADGISALVSFEAGTELLEGAYRVHCDFDDFIIIAQ